MSQTPAKHGRALFRALASREPLRYLASAAVCVVVNNVMLIAGDALGVPYVPLLVLVSFVGGTVGYVLHALVTYRRPLTRVGYASFLGGIALAFPLTLAILAALITGLGLAMWIAAPVATVILLIYNYLNARFAVLRRLLPA